MTGPAPGRDWMGGNMEERMEAPLLGQENNGEMPGDMPPRQDAPLFTVSFTPDKDWASAAVRLHMASRKGLRVLEIVFTVLVGLIMLYEIYVSGITVTAGIMAACYFVVLIAFILAEKRSISLTHRQNEKNGMVTQLFYRDAVVSKSAMTQSSAAYAAFEKMCETDELVALYRDGTHFVAIPKTAIGEKLPELRTFLVEATGKPMRFKRTRRHHLYEILAMAVAAVLIVGFFAALLVGGMIPKVMRGQDDGYAISAASAFQEEQDADYALTAYLDRVALFAWTDRLSYYGYSDGLSYLMDELAYYGVDMDTVTYRQIGENTIAASYVQRGYFFVTAITVNGNTVAMTDVYTPQGFRMIYEPLFYRWISTVSVSAAMY